MTRAIFWETPDRPPSSEGPSVRLDLAWALFLPYCNAGTLPEEHPGALTSLGRWFWDLMGQLTGRLRPDAPDTVWLIGVSLEEGAREYLTRLASFWCDEVYWDYPLEDAPNRWLAPTVDLGHLPTNPLWTFSTETADLGSEHSLAPMLGFGRVQAKVQQVAEGHVSARLHSHTGWDEYYLILKGSGTLRMGRHRQRVTEGTFIAKPSGPDLTSQIIADQGEPVTILDLEVYPDARQSGGVKDVMAYTDHQELVLEGPGWQGMVPQQTLQRTDDLYSHYFAGYVRQRDGSVAPRQFPGHPARADTDQPLE